jgi:hypothetical protein
MVSLEDWLREEDAQTLQERVDRAEKLLKLFPDTESRVLFFGGTESYRAFVEAKLAYFMPQALRVPRG